MNLWQGTFDFGVIHALAFPECRMGAGPILETLPAVLNDPVFGAVEIAPPKDPAVREQARRLVAESGKQVTYLPILPMLLENVDIAAADPAAAGAAMDRVRAMLDEAIAFGATFAMLGPPKDPGPEQRPAVVERFVVAVQALCDYADARAGKRRLFLTLENFDRDIEKKRAIGPTAEAAALAAAVNRANFGLTVDLSHLPLLGESPAQALAAAGEQMIHAHVGNCVLRYPHSPLYGDFHPPFSHPEGENGLPQLVEYLRQLRRTGFWERTARRLGGRPILSVEIRTVATDTPERMLADAKAIFQAAWNQVEGGAA